MKKDWFDYYLIGMLIVSTAMLFLSYAVLVFK